MNENSSIKFDAEKFLKPQERDYETALKEMHNGRKVTHWIWYIFPQLESLGRSTTAKYYGLKNLDEAKAYLENDTLKNRLIEISSAVLEHDKNIEDIMGYPDNMKLCSCMTLFHKAAPEIEIFTRIIDKFYGGKYDENTLRLL